MQSQTPGFERAQRPLLQRPGLTPVPLQVAPPTGAGPAPPILGGVGLDPLAGAPPAGQIKSPAQTVLKTPQKGKEGWPLTTPPTMSYVTSQTQEPVPPIDWSSVPASTTESLVLLRQATPSKKKEKKKTKGKRLSKEHATYECRACGKKSEGLTSSGDTSCTASTIGYGCALSKIAQPQLSTDPMLGVT